MKTPLLFGAVLWLAASGPAAADSVQLNGITCLGREKLACFLLFQESRAQALNFMLAEGESQHGFKLLAVDPAGHRVLLEKNGVQKYVRMNSTPEVLSGVKTMPLQAAKAMAAGLFIADDRDDSFRNFDPAAPAFSQAASLLLPPGIVSGSVGNPNPVNPGENAAPGPNASAAAPGNQPPAGGAGDGGQGAASGAAAGAGNPASDANPAPGVSAGVTITGQNNNSNPASSVWYTESESIEQSRIMTAAEVYAGDMLPLPRTPLTPPATDPRLIGPETYFANYIPGFQVTGFLNQ